MKEEEKRLLTIDLCTRLPYSVKAKCIRLTHVGNINNVSIPLKELQSIEITGYEVSCNIVTFETEYGFGSTEIQDIRPYLRPMSSMTEKECIALSHLKPCYTDAWRHIRTPVPLYVANIEQFDFFLRNHLDWRGLIPMGLALEAPEEMYKEDE